MSKAKQSLKITRGIFDAAKILIGNGATNGEVEKYLKISRDVVTMFRQSETYEDYQALMFERSQRQKRVAAMKAKENKLEKAKETAAQVGAVPAVKLVEPQVVEHRQTVQITATHYMTEELREIKEILKSISGKLAVIVTDLYGVKVGGDADAKPDH